MGTRSRTPRAQFSRSRSCRRPVCVSSYDTQGLYTDAPGTVTADGGDDHDHLVLQGVRLPTSLTDGNGFTYQPGTTANWSARQRLRRRIRLDLPGEGRQRECRLYGSPYGPSGRQNSADDKWSSSLGVPVRDQAGLRVTRKCMCRPTVTSRAISTRSMNVTNGAITFDRARQSALDAARGPLCSPPRGRRRATSRLRIAG